MNEKTEFQVYVEQKLLRKVKFVKINLSSEYAWNCITGLNCFVDKNNLSMDNIHLFKIKTFYKPIQS